MKYRIAVTSAAEANLDGIFRFIALDNPTAALKFIASLRAKTTTLAQNPKRCPFAIENGLDGMELRNLIHGNYRIIFTVDPGQVTILQVRHAARLPAGDE